MKVLLRNNREKQEFEANQIEAYDSERNNNDS